MQKVFKKIIGKKLITNLILLSFVFSIIMPGIRLMAEEESNDNIKDTNIITESVADTDKKEVLKYFKKIYDKQGIDSLKEYLYDTKFKNERLIRLRENLAYQIARDFSSADKVSSLIKPDFISLEPLGGISKEKSTYKDLLVYINREINAQELQLRLITSFETVITHLRDNSILDKSNKLQEKLDLETKLIKALEGKADITSNVLLPELLLENRITKFESSYVETGVKTLDTLTSYKERDISALKDKLEKELSLILLINQIYEVEEDKNEVLDSFSYNLLDLYSKKDIDQIILTNINILIQSETILKYLNDDLYDKYTIDPLVYNQYLEDILEALKSKKDNKVKELSDSFYKFLSNKNQSYLGFNYELNSKYAILQSFSSILDFIDLDIYDNNLNEINKIHPFVRDLKESFEENIRGKQGEELIEEADTIASTSEDTTTTQEVDAVETQDPASQDDEVVSERGNVKEEKTDTKNNKKNVGDGHVRPDDEKEDIIPITETTKKTETTTETDEAGQTTQTDTTTTNETIEPADDDTAEPSKEDTVEVESKIEESTDEGNEDKTETYTGLIGEGVKPEVEENAKEEKTDTKNNKKNVGGGHLSDGVETKADVRPDDEKEDVIPITETTKKTETTTETDEAGQTTQTDTTTTNETIEPADDDTAETPGDDVVETTNENELPQDDVGEDKPAVDDKKENIIPEPETTEIASQSAKIMDLFRGQEDILEKVVRVSQLISENEDILYVDKLINKYKAKEKPAVLIEELISGITSNSNLDDLESVLNNSNLTAEDANEIISLLNQFIVEFGYFDSTTDFSGINGVLRFTPKECANSQNASENINFDFCILTSTDISTKNLIGYNNFTSKVSNEYQASHNNIKINWENNHFNTKIELSDKKHIILGDDNLFDEEDVAEKDDGQVDTEAITSSIPDIDEQAYTMSVLNNPDKLFSSAYANEDFEQVVIYESEDHKKNIVNIFKDNSSYIISKSFEKYFIYNYGNGSEKELLSFKDAVLYKKNTGVIEGFTKGRTERINPDFIITIPSALDKNNNSVKINYKIVGEERNQLDIAVKAASENYPIALKTELVITAKGHTKFNGVIDAESGSPAQFGSAQAIGDFNGDGKGDIAIGSYKYNNNSGRVDVYYFNKELGDYNVQPDLILKGEASGHFGYSLEASDLNDDGLSDLIIGSPMHNKKTGVVEIFYGRKILDENFRKPDVVINGAGEEDEFGTSLLIGDFNNDKMPDLAASSPADVDGQGVVHIFYNELISKSNIISTIVSSIEIAGEKQNGSRFGTSIATGDFDNDGTFDLAVGAPFYKLPDKEEKGRIYLFMQDQEPWTNKNYLCSKDCKADNVNLVIDGSDKLGSKIAVADLNADKKQDLIFILEDHIAIYYQDENKWDDVQNLIIDADNKKTISDLLAIDLNNDKLIDLAVGAGDSTYIFYGKNIEGEYMRPTDADIQLQSAPLSNFGYSLASGNLDGDDMIDFVISAPGYQNNIGRSYIFYGKNVDAQFITSNNEILDDEQEIEEPEEEIEEDTTIPENPTIACSGFTGKEAGDSKETTCTWNETTGPSKGIHKYCIDTENKCTPDIENSERSVEIDEFAGRHTYLRVQAKDNGGESGISVFDILINSPLEFIKTPSDNGSDDLWPTDESEQIKFLTQAKDPDGDQYYMMVCDSNVISEEQDRPICAQKTYCTSEITNSGNWATCSYQIEREQKLIYDWYAFVCEIIEDKHNCSQVEDREGVQGSPFYVKRPPKHGEIKVTNINNGSIEPGDRLRFNLDAKEIHNIPPEKKVKMYICSEDSVGFDYNKNECIGGQMICSSEPTDVTKNNVVCNETAKKPLVPKPSKAGEHFFNAYVEYGVNEWIDGNYKGSYEVNNINPTVAKYINEGDIKILAGESTNVTFSAQVEDLNGWDEIDKVEGVFFDSNQVSSECDANTRNCYVSEKCNLSKIDDMTMQADCAVEIFYNANASKAWKVHVKPTGVKGKITDLKSSDELRVVPPLTAINKETIAIPYKTTDPGKTSEATEVILTNLGNQVVDVLVSGTDLIGKNSILKKELQKWSLDPKFNYEAHGYSLVETATESSEPTKGCANVSLPVHNNEKQDVSIYWKIAVPKNLKPDLYEGEVNFEVTEDSCR